MSNPDHLMIDPPSGWQYGFPKRIPREHLHRATEWMIEQGYPRKLTEGKYFPVRIGITLDGKRIDPQDFYLPPAPLKEKVVAAIRDAWNNVSNDGNPISYYLADAAIAVALEEAAKLAEAKADEWATAWRNRFKADQHMEGKSAGADEIASAIRALKENSNDRHS